MGGGVWGSDPIFESIKTQKAGVEYRAEYALYIYVGFRYEEPSKKTL